MRTCQGDSKERVCIKSAPCICSLTTAVVDFDQKWAHAAAPAGSRLFQRHASRQGTVGSASGAPPRRARTATCGAYALKSLTQFCCWQYMSLMSFKKRGKLLFHRVFYMCMSPITASMVNRFSLLFSYCFVEIMKQFILFPSRFERVACEVGAAPGTTDR